jgi:hypothetical protein
VQFACVFPCIEHIRALLLGAGYVMRSIGLTPTDKEAEELGSSVANEDGTIAIDAFQHMVAFP